MDFGTVLLLLGAIAAVVFQVKTTQRVWKSDVYDRNQKMNQTKLIWFVPVFGALAAFSILQQEDERFRPDSHERDDRR